MVLLSGPSELAYRAKLAGFEGRFPFLYLDGPGNVSVGVGCLIPSAEASAALNWTGPAGIDPRDEWRTVEAAQPDRIAAFYAPLTQLRLSDAEIDSLLDVRLSQAEQGLIAVVASVVHMPEPARTGLLDMCFNLGATKLKNQFFGPQCRFGPAVYRGDWPTAARESARKEAPAAGGIQPERNRYVFDLFNSLAPEVS